MISIRAVNVSLRSLNLNLLLVLDALVRLQNVTHAARELGLTQSAVSNSLAQLRVALDDPLFVRARRGVVPTERARALGGPVRQALALIESALTFGPSFDPAQSSRTFVIAASDYTEYVVLPTLIERLARAAPNIRIEVRPWGQHEVAPMLESGDADLMLGYYGALPPGHHEEALFSEEYVCILRAGHPLSGRSLTLKRYLELSHVLVTQRPSGLGSVDKALAERNLTRRIGARVSHFLMVPQLVAQTDMVAALSRRVAEPAARQLGLVLHAPPLPLPRSTVGQVWHERSAADPAHAWLRRTLCELCSQL